MPGFLIRSGGTVRSLSRRGDVCVICPIGLSQFRSSFCSFVWYWCCDATDASNACVSVRSFIRRHLSSVSSKPLVLLNASARFTVVTLLWSTTTRLRRSGIRQEANRFCSALRESHSLSESVLFLLGKNLLY